MTFGIIERDSGKVDDVLLKSADKLLYRGKINGKMWLLKHNKNISALCRDIFICFRN